jgi:hypothetical protein
MDHHMELIEAAAFESSLVDQVLLGVGQWVEETTSSRGNNIPDLLSGTHPYTTG